MFGWLTCGILRRANRGSHWSMRIRKYFRLQTIVYILQNLRQCLKLEKVLNFSPVNHFREKMLNTLVITAAPVRWAHSSHAGSILSSYKRASYIIQNSLLFTSSFTSKLHSIYFSCTSHEWGFFHSFVNNSNGVSRIFWYMDCRRLNNYFYVGL